LLTGVALVAFLGLTGRDPFHGINAGFIALCCNFAVTLAFGRLASSKAASFDFGLAENAAQDSFTTE
jgi:hypothetical protein